MICSEDGIGREKSRPALAFSTDSMLARMPDRWTLMAAFFLRLGDKDIQFARIMALPPPVGPDLHEVEVTVEAAPYQRFCQDSAPH